MTSPGGLLSSAKIRSPISTALLCIVIAFGQAAAARADDGKLLATSGVSQIEGAAGGGLTPWALISGYETRDSIGVTAHYTYVPLRDFTLQTPGIAVGLYDRVEFSYAKQFFSTEDVGATLGLGKDFTFEQDIFGVKVKLLGDAVYDQDSLLPQIAVGAQYKRNSDGNVVRALGAKDNDGIDYYASATKLFLAQSLLVNGTMRMTKANQFGLLGFGGDKNDDYKPEFEGSAALLLSRKFAIGAEYRMKPDNLGVAKEDDAWDLFAAYFFNKNLSATLAYVNLGNIAGVPGTTPTHDQTGAYLSVQVSF